MKNISFTVDGKELEGTLFYPEKLKKENPAILFVHGWMSSQKRNKDYSKELSAMGFICMTFDLRSHGESEGDRKTLSIQNYLQDVKSAYDFLIKQKGVTSIYLVGSSFGAYLGAILTMRRKIAGVVLRVPAMYPDEGFELSKVHYSNKKVVDSRNKKLSPNEAMPLKAINQYHESLLIIESENDDIVPHQTIENYINAASNNKSLHI